MRRLFLFWRQGGRDLRLLWRALQHPDRPAWLLPATVLLAFFALDPLSLAMPMLGAVDDLVLLPLALRALLSALPQHLKSPQG
ncbi:hypothetical protein [Scleromatobacter humisilvae]|uniref:DUF1232 domain-containing protein n=1 Tax=Scleromatobacter humisilvae TaxID=2897159 RepID=A0A9X1YNK7_9BURK|nr:hypothetical protein [Scleromatobacter humisilvae]MCK9689321.1 hypothetical protein [Scleromatobacter humisilvae]